MGYDIVRFVESTVDKDLVICPICLDVFEQPVELPECQHIFCSACIGKCFAVKKECPLDRMPVVFSSSQPRKPNRSLRTIMERLRIRCIYFEQGCSQVLDLAQMEHHQKRCSFRPTHKIQNEAKHIRSANCEGREDADSSTNVLHQSHHSPHYEGESYVGIWLTLCFIVVLIFTLFRRR